MLQNLVLSVKNVFFTIGILNHVSWAIPWLTIVGCQKTFCMFYCFIHSFNFGPHIGPRIGLRIVIFQFSSLFLSIAIICLPIFGNVLLILVRTHFLHWGTIFGKFYATWNRALIAFEALLNLPWIWFTMGKYIHKKKAGLSGIIFNRAE